MAGKTILDKLSIYIPQAKMQKRPVERLIKLGEKTDRSPSLSIWIGRRKSEIGRTDVFDLFDLDFTSDTVTIQVAD